MTTTSRHELNWMPVNEAAAVLHEFNGSFVSPRIRIMKDIHNGRLPVAEFVRSRRQDFYLIHEEDLQVYLKTYCR